MSEIDKASLGLQEAFRDFQKHLLLAAQAYREALMKTRKLSWRERIRPRWRIFEWIHDLRVGEGTFLLGKRVKLYRGVKFEDWMETRIARARQRFRR